MAEITVITVQFGNPEDTAVLAGSLAKLDGAESIELIVVDNAAREDSQSRFEALDHSMPYRVRGFSPAGNLYYWGGASFALETIRAEGESPARWVIICNNDITIDEPGFLTSLMALDPARYPIVAPSIVSAATGREQNPLLEEPAGFFKRLKWRIYDTNFAIATAMLGAHGFLTRLRDDRRPAQHEVYAGNFEKNVYAPHGACVILSSQFFARGGVLDTTVPLYAEELTLASDAKKRGFPITFIPRLRVTHFEHSTTGTELTPEKYEMQRRARRHYYSLPKSKTAASHYERR